MWPCVLCAFDIFLNKNISQIQQCYMVPAGWGVWNWNRRRVGGDNSCVTSKMRNDQSECLAVKLHMQQPAAAAGQRTRPRERTPTGTSSAATCNIHAEPAQQMCALSARLMRSKNCSSSKSRSRSSCCSKVISKSVKLQGKLAVG